MTREYTYQDFFAEYPKRIDLPLSDIHVRELRSLFRSERDWLDWNFPIATAEERSAEWDILKFDDSKAPTTPMEGLIDKIISPQDREHDDIVEIAKSLNEDGSYLVKDAVKGKIFNANNPRLICKEMLASGLTWVTETKVRKAQTKRKFWKKKAS